MCDTLKAAGCEEGNDLYDKDVPGPKGVPNLSCKLFCEKLQNNGYFVNPRCILQVQKFTVPSCPEIEVARAKTCHLT